MSGGGDLLPHGHLDLDRERRTLDFQFGSIRVTAVGVAEFDARTTYEEAREVALWASGFVNVGKWVLGDMLLFVRRRKSDPHDDWNYEQIAAETGRSVGGLMNIVSVCNRVPYEVRRPWLPFGVHEAVAKLDRAKQIRWLDRVEHEHLSVEDLRGLLADPGPNESLDPSAVTTEDPRTTSPSQLQIERPSLRDLAVEIVAMPQDEHGMTCIGSNLRERLRAALETS